MNQETPEILVFKTDLATNDCISRVGMVLDEHPHIEQWNVDCQDVDCVLRIVPARPLHPQEVVGLVKNMGFFCEELPD